MFYNPYYQQRLLFGFQRSSIIERLEQERPQLRARQKDVLVLGKEREISCRRPNCELCGGQRGHLTGSCTRTR